jgi:hypothetical protein
MINLQKIIELVKNLIPEVQLNGIKVDNSNLIKINDFNLGNTQNTYNAINISIGTIGSKNDPLAIVAPTTQGEAAGQSIAFLPKVTKEQKPKIDIQKVPLSSGFHLIVNQRGWWSKEKDKEKSIISIGYIKLIPICKEDWNFIRTFGDQNRFGFQVNGDGDIYVKIWADERDAKKHTELSNQKSRLFSFQEYYASDIIRFERFKEIVISLDINVVEKAILVEYKPENSELEYFVFILAKD